jgi:hypothetical protein
MWMSVMLMRQRQGDEWPRHRAKWREQRKRDTRKGRRKMAAWAAETGMIYTSRYDGLVGPKRPADVKRGVWTAASKKRGPFSIYRRGLTGPDFSRRAGKLLMRP